MIAVYIAIAYVLRLVGIDAHLYEDGSFGIADVLSACVLPALGC